MQKISSFTEILERVQHSIHKVVGWSKVKRGKKAYKGDDFFFLLSFDSLQ